MPDLMVSRLLKDFSLDKASKWTRAYTFLVCVLSFLFIGKALFANWHGVAKWKGDISGAVAVAIAIVLYGCSLFILAEGWRRILKLFDVTQLPLSLTYLSYTRTQVAKYLPGNVFHFVGRQLFLARRGVPHRALIGAAAIEAAALIAGAGVVSLVGLYFDTLLTSTERMNVAIAVIALTVAALLAAGIIVFRVRDCFSSSSSWRIRSLAGVMFCSLSFFVAQAGIFALLCRTVTDDFPIYLSSAALAWISGYVVVGAPGGIGIRESVLVLLLEGSVPVPEILIAAGLFRLVTTLGDGLCFLLGEVLAKYLAWKDSP